MTYSVGADANVASLLVLDQPSPAGTLNTSQSGVHLVLELTKATVGVVDSLGKSTRWGLTTTGALGSQVLPEQAVVQVTTTVEVDGGLQGDLGGNVALVLSLLQLLNGGVVAGDVGVVVVLVVQLHDLSVDSGLKGAIVVYFDMLVQVTKQNYTKYAWSECADWFRLTGKVRQSSLAAGKGQASNAGLGGSRSSRAKGNAGRVGKDSSHCE